MHSPAALGIVLTSLAAFVAQSATLGASSNVLHEFDLSALAARQADKARLLAGSESAAPALLFTPAREKETLEVWRAGDPGAWSSAGYLVCEVFHTNASSAILNFDFHRGNRRSGEQIVQQGGEATGAASAVRISPKIGVLPGLRTQVVFPLSFLDGQEIFLPRFPRQLKGTVMGSRLDRSEIAALRLRLSPVQPPDYASQLLVHRIYLTAEPPEPLPPETQPYVDALGQWAGKHWPGKIPDEATLKKRLLALEKQTAAAAYPARFSRYGGWRDKSFKATGYFRTQHDGKRWWLVDPEGFAFLSLGMDCVSPGISSPTREQEDLFAWLPKAEGQFADAVSRRGGVDFLRANLIRVYGPEHWRPAWERLTTGLLKQAGFNTIANWSDLEFARRAQIPYVLPMSGFPGTDVRLYRDFPDVFAEEYRESARRFARQLDEYKDDPYLIGYFLSNEPHWAFGKNNLAFEMFATSQPSETKKEFVRWIRTRYADDLSRFNNAWKLALTSLADLARQTFRDPPSPAAESDFWEFSGIMAERYVAVPCEAVKEVDPHHLNLGMRYAWISSDLLYRAGRYFDVYSINGYSFPGPPETAEIARRSEKPVMIGEFHFGATDRGLPATGIQGTPTQAERAKAFRYYVEHGFRRPEVVGLHYFQWLDQSITGRHDGENYNIGFIDTCHQPYPELMQSARVTAERLYSVASGETDPVQEKPRRAPQIYY